MWFIHRRIPKNGSQEEKTTKWFYDCIKREILRKCYGGSLHGTSRAFLWVLLTSHLSWQPDFFLTCGSFCQFLERLPNFLLFSTFVLFWPFLCLRKHAGFCVFFVNFSFSTYSHNSFSSFEKRHSHCLFVKLFYNFSYKSRGLSLVTVW